ncbi:hypothetical protein ACMFMG_007503 [Clarireedia jacksonii]
MPTAYFRLISSDEAPCAERSVERRFLRDVTQDPVLTKTAPASRLSVTGQAAWKRPKWSDGLHAIIEYIGSSQTIIWVLLPRITRAGNNKNIEFSMTCNPTSATTKPELETASSVA